MEFDVTSIKRAPFSSDLESTRILMTQLIPILEATPDWYGSIYFERKTSRSYSANLKQSQLSENVSQGMVFRIYNGYTLFEEATDELDPERLKSIATHFSKKVMDQNPPPGISKKTYNPPTWTERLAAPIDYEITTQIPSLLTASTPVHFGIRYQIDPQKQSTSQVFQNLKELIEKCKTIALQEGLEPKELTYVTARETRSTEESLFVDRETNMSQTLFRVSLRLITMSGPERTFLSLGGLGGLESIHYDESDLRNLLKDLKSLKTADRIKPGKYRVIFGPVLTGVLAHEAFGHSQEADTCARGRSKAWDLYQSGTLVGNQHATILNNPAIFENAGFPYAAWGSYFFDEEGWLAQEQVLLEKGKLLAPMTNLTSSIRLKVPRTANGKRESWAHGVYTRQTNTYFSPGDKTLQELLVELKDGFIGIHPAGGMEDPKGMGIQVGISFLHEVKDGNLTGKIFKGPAGGDIQMTGYTPDVLNSIIAKSKIDYQSSQPDHSKYPYNDVGGCGKYHKEFVYAGCGGPYLLLNQVTLG